MSIDKIATTYFACVTNETFTFNGKEYHPRPLQVSPLIFRGFKCPPMCGGCCGKFTLDYLPIEDRPDICQSRYVEFNGKQVELYSDLQKDNTGPKCRNLNMENGRCNIHVHNPFSCDFELIRFMISSDTERRNIVSTKLFGRGWQMKRIDGERGALCEIVPMDDESHKDTVRKLKRLKQWTEHFGLKTKVDIIIDWAENVVPNLDIISALKLNAAGENTEEISTLSEFIEV